MPSDLEALAEFIANSQIEMINGFYTSKDAARDKYHQIWWAIVTKAREQFDYKWQFVEFLGAIAAGRVIPDQTEFTVSALWDIQEGFKE